MKGILFAFFPTIMVDMKFIMNTSMSLISLQPVLETIGYTIGTFVGLTYKWLNRQIVMALFFIIICAVSAATPMLEQLWMLYLFALIFGIGSSITVSGYVVWTIDMWKEKSAPILQTNSLGFGLGSVLCTTIIGPYLTGDVGPNDLNGQTGSHFENVLHLPSAKNYSELLPSERRDKLIFPSIMLCNVLCAGMYLLFYHSNRSI